MMIVLVLLGGGLAAFLAACMLAACMLSSRISREEEAHARARRQP